VSNTLRNVTKTAQAPLAHWDDVPAHRRAAGHIDGRWQSLGDAAGAVGVGLQRIRIEPLRWSTPVHVHGASEEIFVVLGGSGLAWQDGATYEVEPGDALVHRARAEVHSLRAGEDGLDVIVFGTRTRDDACHLPRAGVSWHAVSWAEAGGEHPDEREAAAGEPELPAPSDRPSRIVRMRALEPASRTGATVARERRDIGRPAGSVTSGLTLVTVAPGKLAAPPHCHSAEEELFVVLAGEGTLLLGDGEHRVARGHVVARPPGTGVAHTFRAGPSGLELLAYGTHVPDDILFYPRSGKVFLRGLGVVGRIEPVDFWDGED
jgi:uncharacterized cupin superfamily protein